MIVFVRCLAPIAVVAVIDGALLGGIAAVITSVGGIIAVALSYRHGKTAASVPPAPPAADDATLAVIAVLERSLELERDEVRALRAELRRDRADPDDPDVDLGRRPSPRRRPRQ